MELIKPQLSSLAQSAVSKRLPLPTLAGIARHVIMQKLENIQYGRILFKFRDGQVLSLGSGSEAAVELKIVSEQFWIRVLLYADLVRHILSDSASSK